MSGTLDPDAGGGGGPPIPGGPGGAPGGGPPGGGAPGGLMPGGPPPGFPQRGMRPAVPGAGTRAGGMLKLLDALKMMQLALVELPIGSEVHRAATKAVQDLSKHLKTGPETEGISQTNIGQLLQQLARGAMAGRAQGPGAQGQPAMPPMTPLPGA